ncbi:hypothetical protein L0156_09895 [bacterium]|nr:hypothetical protein [bacterium]
MDAINKFPGLRQTVISEPQESEIPLDQATQKVSSTGIASVPDAVETFQAPAFDLTTREKQKRIAEENQKQLAQLEAELAEQKDEMDSFWGGVKSFFGDDGGLRPGSKAEMTTPYSTTQTETVEASALFDVLTADGPPIEEAVPVSDLRQVLAFARAENKQVLTAANFNAFLSENSSKYGEIAANLRQVVNDNFYLTPNQRQIFERFSEKDFQQIQDAANRALETNQSIEISIFPDNEAGLLKITHANQQNELIQIADQNCDEALKNFAKQLEVQRNLDPGHAAPKIQNYGIE